MLLRREVQDVNVVIVGSCMIDFVARVKVLPRPGETVLSEKFDIYFGGKGFNQAVTVARLGAKSTLITCLGNDPYAHQFVTTMQEEAIVHTYVMYSSITNTGTSLIIVGPDGENRIIASPLSNMDLNEQMIEQAASAIVASDVVLMHLEVPVTSLERVAEIANSSDATVILNPAPAKLLPPNFLKLVDVIVLNEIEFEFYTSRKVLSNLELIVPVARSLIFRENGKVIITLGSKGVLYVDNATHLYISPYTVSALDTTGAGDAFCGALAVGVACKREINFALNFANAAGAFAVTKHGAAPSMPRLDNVLKILSKTLK